MLNITPEIVSWVHRDTVVYVCINYTEKNMAFMLFSCPWNWWAVAISCKMNCHHVLAFILHFHHSQFRDNLVEERTSYFCLVRKLIWPLGSTYIFTQWRWPILFSPDHFSGQNQNGESPHNYLFLRTFRTGQAFLLSAPFIAAASQHPEESHLIYGPFESTLLDQGFPVEYELDVFNPPHTGIPSRRL